VLDGMMWWFRVFLPPLFAFPAPLHPEEITGALPGLRPAAIALAAAGFGLFSLAAVLHLRRPYEPAAIWLGPALVLAAYSNLHSMLVPTVFTGRVATGDLLRLAFSLVLLIGVAREVRQSFVEQRRRSDELARAYAAEQERSRELEGLERSKAELFAVLTHELMHPVAAIRGMAVTLEEAWDKLSDPDRHKFTGRIAHQSEMLRDLAEEAATAISLESDTFALLPREISATDLVREVRGAVGDLDGRLRIDVQAEVEHRAIRADAARLQQVFRNLLSNAQKYGEPGTQIDLRVTSSDGEVVFSVTDRGPGVPHETMPLLFQRFTRIRPPGREHVPGSGLGLYISRRIVEAHGGRIWVESEPGEGATFRFAVPWQ
jgi:signal transduction histidine kinase